MLSWKSSKYFLIEAGVDKSNSFSGSSFGTSLNEWGENCPNNTILSPLLPKVHIISAKVKFLLSILYYIRKAVNGV